MPASSRLLLTGGTGFVGRRLAPGLAAQYPDHELVMVARAPGEVSPSNWREVVVDLTEAATVETLIRELRPQIIIHLAAQSSVGQITQQAEATWDVNFGASFSLAKAIAQYVPDATLLFTSSAEVYGASFNVGPVREDMPAAPLNSYATAKLAAERMFQDVLPDASRLIVARAFNHSGARHDERFVLPSFAAQIARAEARLQPPRIVVGNLCVERDFLHVEDVVEAYLGLLAAGDRLPGRLIVNVASGEASRLSVLLDQMRQRARCPIEIEQDPARIRSSDIPRAVGDATRLRELIGWRPRRTVDDILDELLDYSRAEAKALKAQKSDGFPD